MVNTLIESKKKSAKFLKYAKSGKIRNHDDHKRWGAGKKWTPNDVLRQFLRSFSLGRGLPI